MTRTQLLRSATDPRTGTRPSHRPEERHPAGRGHVLGVGPLLHSVLQVAHAEERLDGHTLGTVGQQDLVTQGRMLGQTVPQNHTFLRCKRRK